MKKLICLLLALTILFAAALAESGLKERRPADKEILPYACLDKRAETCYKVHRNRERDEKMRK